VKNPALELVLRSFKEGAADLEEAKKRISALYSTDLGFANIDLRREERTGFPEVVFCEGKSDAQAAAIILETAKNGRPVFATRSRPSIFEAVKKENPLAVYDLEARTLSIGEFVKKEDRAGLVIVACAGTSDINRAKEAFNTAEFFGSNTRLIADIGVAGIHRLFSRMDELREAKVVVAAAGMEGALAGVLAGLLSVPVIALPTSVGYGAAFGGISALLGMLTSCAPGVSVVNIDNGFGAGYQANLINRASFR
jgi:NCAIR mutase (PurE)-related protein